MKKFLLLFTIILVNDGLHAQRAKTDPKYLYISPPFNCQREPSSTNFLKRNKRPQRSQAGCVGDLFTYSPNAFGVGGGYTTFKQNCLYYNNDLNTVLWTHRSSPYWNFSGYTIGSIQATWMNVGSNQWDSMIIYRDSSGYASARYPGGCLYNPVGNTSISNALMVGSGPVTQGAGWLGTWYSSRQPSGNYYLVDASLDNNQVAMGPGLFAGVATSNGDKGFLNNDMQQVGNKVLVGGPLSDGFSSPNPFYNHVKGGEIGNMAGGSWGEDTLVPGFYHSSNMGYINDGVGMRMAFDPTGIIGYAVFIGRDSTSYGNNADSTLMPIVYKSLNGGSTWNSLPMLSGYDWPLYHPELFLNVGKLRPQAPGQYKLFTNDGIDLMVDSLGVLHLVATVTDPFLGSTGAIDSLNFSYTYNWDYRDAHPVIWDLMTDGTTWSTMLVDSIMTRMPGSDPAVDTTTQFSCWTNAPHRELAFS